MTENNIFLVFTILIIMALLLILCFILCMISFSKCNKLKKRLANSNIDEKLEEAERKVKSLLQNAKASDKQTPTIISDSNAIRKIGIERFDAFAGITGAFSFSLAMLDDNQNGIILTTLYGHESCNTYVREIKAGASDVTLLDEEKKALNKAKNM